MAAARSTERGVSPSHTHSSIPWTACDQRGSTHILDSRGKQIALIYKVRDFNVKDARDAAARADANREFIVRAVNTHAALLEALEWMLSYHNNGEEPDPFVLEQAELAVIQAKAGDR